MPLATRSGSCTEFEDTDDDGTVTRYMIAARLFDNIADDQIALRLDLESDQFSGTFDIVAARGRERHHADRRPLGDLGGRCGPATTR